MTRCYHNLLLQYRSLTANTLHFFRLSLIGSLLIIAISCEEDPTQIGENILPDSDFVSIFSTDTIGVRTFTNYSDSIRTDNPQYSFLGQLYDPFFGTTTAEFVTQIRLGTTWNYDIFTIDSVKLFLSFLNVTGNASAGHVLKLSEISDQIYQDSSYFSNRAINHTGYSLDITLPELSADTVNNVVLDLPVEFGNYLTRNTDLFFHSNAEPDFMSYFKGLHFQIIPAGDPSFITMSVYPVPAGSYSNLIVLYLHDENNAKSEFGFIIDASVRKAAFNIYKHDYTTAEPGKKFDDKINKYIPDTLSYLQGLNGVFTRISLSSLTTIKNDPSFDGISINRASLTFPYWNEGTGYKLAEFPSQLLMRYTDINGIKYYVPDYITSSAFYDGTVDTVAGVYNFNIGTFIQNYLQDTENTIKPELDLFVQSNSTQKVIMRANGNSKPVKFEFTYTKF